MKRPPQTLPHHIRGNIYANEAGLKFWQQLQANRDPHDHLRCVWDAPWQCPYARRGEGFPCTGKLNKPDLVEIAYVNHTVAQELNTTPTGQIDLFQPTRRVWRHFRTGEEMEPYPPPAPVQHFCKEMALAFTKWLERTQGYHDVPAWRILPMTETKADQKWKDEMIEKHNLRACVFDRL